MHQWAANIIKCKALVANIQELRKMYWIMTFLLSYNRFESKGLTRDRLLPIWINLSRKEPKPQNLAMSHFTQNNCKSCTSDKYQLTTLSNSSMILFITWIFVDQSFIFFSDVLIQTWQIWINFFHYTADVHTTYKLNWRSSFRTLIKGCVWIFNPIITIFTVVFPSKECFLFTKKW